MYRNGFGSRTQTQTTQSTQSNQSNQANQANQSTQPQNASNFFNGNYSTLGNNNQSQTDDEIIFAIVTCNITNIRRLINSSNVNNIIDKKNKYTALHHAVRIKKNDQIIEYLMACGADPKIKQDEGKDCIDMSIEANYRFLIDRIMKDQERELDNLYTKYDDLNYKVKGIERTNQDLTQKNEYLTKSNTEYVKKIESLKIENTDLKRKFDESEKAFNNLLKKTRKI